MNRLDRISAILIQLQSKRLVTSTEIAERFEVSQRTVYRDIKTLMEAGVPIGVEDGKGYFIADGYRLPPVMFTEEEAYALITAEKILAQLNEHSLKQNYASAVIKIRAVLQAKAREKVEYLGSRMAHVHPWAPQTAYLSQIQGAITDHRVTDIHYLSGSKNENTKRLIHPYALYFTGVVWNVIGFCTLRKDLREFRLDRVVKLTVLDGSFTPDPAFRLEKYLEQRTGKFP